MCRRSSASLHEPGTSSGCDDLDGVCGNNGISGFFEDDVLRALPEDVAAEFLELLVAGFDSRAVIPG